MGCLHRVPSQTFLDCFLIYRYGFLNRQEYTTGCITKKQFCFFFVFLRFNALFSDTIETTKNSLMKYYVSSMKN